MKENVQEETGKQEKCPRKIYLAVAVLAVFAMLAIALYIVFRVQFISGGSLPPEKERVIAVSRLWQAAREHYCYFDEMETGWDAAYEEAVGQVLSAKDRRAYVRALEEFRAVLRDGHGDGEIFGTGIQNIAALPFRLDYMGGAYVVTGSIDQKVAPGDILTAIEGEDPTVWLERELGPVVSIETPLARECSLASRFWTYYPLGRRINCTFENQLGQTCTVTAASGSYRSGEQKSLTLSSGMEEDVLLEHEAFRVTRMRNGVIYLQNFSMRDPSYWDVFCEQVLPLIEDAEGVILDLRSNQGGISAIGARMLRAVTGKPAPDSSLQQLLSLRLSQDVTYSALLTGPLSDLFQRNMEAGGYDVQGLIKRGQDMAQGRFFVTEEQYAAILELLGEPSFLNGGPDTGFAVPENGPSLPLIVLIGSHSGSAVDTTAQTAKDMDIPTLGTRTHGADGDIFSLDLGDGITTSFSSFYIYNQDTEMPVNNCGIEADIYLDYALPDLRNGIDTQLLQAWKLLTS